MYMNEEQRSMAEFLAATLRGGAVFAHRYVTRRSCTSSTARSSFLALGESHLRRSDRDKVNRP